jgi:nucleoside-diphosphate-sugar epimerase
MTTLIVGATGKTGRSVVEQLLRKKHKVRIVVRSTDALPCEVLESPNITVIEASVLDLTDGELAEHTRECDAVVSCLGHVLSFTGVLSGRPTTRANVAHFMVELIERADLWDTWKFKMPVVMNSQGAEPPQ